MKNKKLWKTEHFRVICTLIKLDIVNYEIDEFFEQLMSDKYSS